VITLELTDEQAVALARVVGRVGGNPDGMRGHIDHVVNSLRKQGVEYDIYTSETVLDGNLYFVDLPLLPGVKEETEKVYRNALP
jgi:uncharacterized protein YqgV (UPF0045/DUF77 family)